MESNKKTHNIGPYIVAAIVILGCFILASVCKLKSYDRTVSVRGLCEREVMADKAIYPIVYKETGDNLNGLYETVQRKNETIIAFLKEMGIAENEITIPAPKIRDNYTTGYNTGSPNRYVISSVVNVCTEKVSTILELQRKQSALLDKGIAIGNGDNWETPVIYEFEGLNEIKPDMIEEANLNARKAGEQFAKDSGSKLGKIKEATQGLFSIESRDMNTPHIKKVRVVTNVTYYLR